MKTLRVATCQFSVEPEVEHNCRWVLKQMKQAAEQGARIAHFSECALSGYLGVDLATEAELDWAALWRATETIQQAARRLKMWVALGSTHRLSPGNRPHNSVYVINPRGRIVGRYDKRYCTGELRRRPTHDLAHYSPGDHFTTFRISGVRCGVLICYDYRFPELYREYRRAGVDVLLQSFHNARSTVVNDPKYNIWRTIVPATMSCRAAENYFWISANNSTTRPSRWASFAVQPDGQVVGRLKLHQPGVLVTDMLVGPGYFDAAGPWRETTLKGQLHSGLLVDDPRSRDVTSL
ncbi:MAG: carbon-nitrogen hydrolase [Planctomycetaceae bacterium]|nr:carbon-nitrogen hydrolase [Planctomycetaceae bacterium]